MIKRNNYLPVSRNEKGFTFLELLLVLSVVAIISAVIIPVGEKWIRTSVEEDALHLLISTIHSMQGYAIANGKATKVEFIKIGKRTKYITAIPGKQMSETYLPDGMRISNSSYLDSVEFHPNGDIIKFGSITLITTTGIIEIKFQFQRGRMIIAESERLFMAGIDINTRNTRRYFRDSSSASNEIDFWAT